MNICWWWVSWDIWRRGKHSLVVMGMEEGGHGGDRLVSFSDLTSRNVNADVPNK